MSINDDVTMLLGKHQLVFGGEFVRNQLNISNAYESNGIFSFNGSFSGSGPNGGSTIGDQTLDFLQGTQNSFQQSKFQQNALRAPIPSLYGQDTYHATKQLTLIAGMRWSPEYAPTDTKNRGTIFDYASFLANKVSSVYPNALRRNVLLWRPWSTAGLLLRTHWASSLSNVGRGLRCRWQRKDCHTRRGRVDL